MEQYPPFFLKKKNLEYHCMIFYQLNQVFSDETGSNLRSLSFIISFMASKT